MYSLALIKFGGFEDPKVVASIVAKRHGLSIKVLFQHLVLGLLLVCLLGWLILAALIDLLVSFALLAFLTLVLLN